MNGKSASRRRDGEKGFTVVELLVGILVTSVLLAAFAAFNRYQLFTFLDTTRQLSLQSTGRSFVDLFTGEVRRACALAAGDPHQIRFRADLDGSGSIDAPNEDVTYRWTAVGTVERTTAGFTDVLVTDVPQGGFVLRYFDENGVELLPGESGALTPQQLDAVRRVRVQVRLEQPSTDPNRDRLLRTAVTMDVTMRNRFFVNAFQNSGCPPVGGA